MERFARHVNSTHEQGSRHLRPATRNQIHWGRAEATDDWPEELSRTGTTAGLLSGHIVFKGHA